MHVYVHACVCIEYMCIEYMCIEYMCEECMCMECMCMYMRVCALSTCARSVEVGARDAYRPPVPPLHSRGDGDQQREHDGQYDDGVLHAPCDVLLWSVYAYVI